MLQYSERVSVQQKCDFLFFFSVDDCVWVMTGRRGTVAQGTLGHCSTVGTAGTSAVPRPALCMEQPLQPVARIPSPFSSPQHHPLFLADLQELFYKGFQLPWVPQEAAGSPVPLSEQWGLRAAQSLSLVGSEPTFTRKGISGAQSKFPPFDIILVCIWVYPWKLT